MKVAHLIMAYKNPLQLERLIQQLNHPQMDVYIHLDKKVNYKDYKYLKSLKRVFFIRNRTVCNWGGFSFVQAISRSIREVLAQEEKYDFINLLSAQDYPIKPISSFYEFLENHSDESFISFEKLTAESKWWKHAVTRYELYHFTDFNLKGRYLFQGLFNKIMPMRNFPLPYNLFGSAVSSWWTLRSDCAQYIVDFLDSNPKLLSFMKFTWAADEFLYPTIIMNSPFKEKVSNNNLRLIEWEDGKSNPRIFDLNDFETLKYSKQFFARKFDITVDSVILDKLDRYLEESISM